MLGGAKVSSVQRKHKSHEWWTLIHVAFNPAVQDVHVSDPWFRSGLHAQVPRQEGDSCVRRCVRSLEGQRGYRKAGGIQVWFRSLWPFVWQQEGVAAGFVPYVSCFAETMGGASGILLVIGNEVRWGQRCS